MTNADLEFPASRRDVVYGNVAGRALLCDVYPPAGESKRMAIVHIHGGAFRGGSKEMIGPKVQGYSRRGFTGIAVSYRLSGEAKWPAQIEDVKACIRWVRANATELGIEQDRIAVAGYSAGGHLALMAASTIGRGDLEGDGGNAGVSSAIAACLAYYPAPEITRPADGSAHQLMAEDATDADYRAASPIFTIGAQTVPTVFFHGTADAMIPPAASEKLYAALVAAGVPAELHTFHGVSHEFDRHPEFAEQCAALAGLFIDHQVLDPRTYPPFMPRSAPAPAS
jgi:acetyl esterase/lipase